MRHYLGFSYDLDVYVYENNHSRPLEPRLDLRSQSPTGFAWGYSGSGPAQLALAILADAIGDDEIALRHYQMFKRHIVAKLPQGRPWTLSVDAVREVVATYEQA